MLKKTEKTLLNHLRRNSRKSLSKIRFETGIPTSTLFNSLKKLESNVILKHCSILDFSKSGFPIRINFAIKCKSKMETKDLLTESKHVNSLYALMEDHDLYAECAFRDMKEVSNFRHMLEELGVIASEETFILEELKREGLLIQ